MPIRYFISFYFEHLIEKIAGCYWSVAVLTYSCWHCASYQTLQWSELHTKCCVWWLVWDKQWKIRNGFQMAWGMLTWNTATRGVRAVNWDLIGTETGTLDSLCTQSFFCSPFGTRNFSYYGRIIPSFSLQGGDWAPTWLRHIYHKHFWAAKNNLFQIYWIKRSYSASPRSQE